MPAILTLDDIRRIVPYGAPDSFPLPEGRSAAVALLLWQSPAGLCLCIGRRPSRPGDPWSGDMAFPGGKASPGDANLHEVAARETEEEIGLRVGPAHLIGSLGRLSAFAGEGRPWLPVYPMLYALESDPGPLRPGEELVEAHWVPLAQLWDPASWVAVHYAPEGKSYSGVWVADHHVWGFTLRALVTLGDVVGRPIRGLLWPSDLEWM